MKKIAIIHNLPVDYYPPAVNLFNTLRNRITSLLLTSEGEIGDCLLPKSSHVRKLFNEKRKGNKYLYLIKQIKFIIASIIELWKFKPDYILYYESISSFVPFFYSKLINNKVKIFVHYHEYLTKDEYQRRGMKLWEIGRRIEEKYLLKKCDWISHTNIYRLNFFKNDYQFLDNSILQILPNYPPKSWKKESHYQKDDIIRCVYIGSLSTVDMYLEKFLKWVKTKKGKITVDFYSFNFHPEVLELFKNIDSSFIKLIPTGIKYSEIPVILNNYDVGLLLYKAKTINYKFNETNKLYEYLICGLNVWYPTSMTLVEMLASSKQFEKRLMSYNPDLDIWPSLNDQNTFIDNSSYNKFCEIEYQRFFKIISQQE